MDLKIFISFKETIRLIQKPYKIQMVSIKMNYYKWEIKIIKIKMNKTFINKLIGKIMEI